MSASWSSRYQRSSSVPKRTSNRPGASVMSTGNAVSRRGSKEADPTILRKRAFPLGLAAVTAVAPVASAGRRQHMCCSHGWSRAGGAETRGGLGVRRVAWLRQIDSAAVDCHAPSTRKRLGSPVVPALPGRKREVLRGSSRGGRTNRESGPDS